jgi:hypothetical protein
MSHHDKKNAPTDDPFATIDLGTLDKVSGGAGDDMGSMMMPMMMMMMMRGRGGSAPPPPPPAPVRPKILLNGVEQPYTGNNLSFNSGGGNDGSSF